MASPSTDAGDTALYLGIGGVLGTLGGSALIWTGRPGGEVDDGYTFIAYVGFLVVVLAQLALFVALVAWGVMLGIRWSGISDNVHALATRGRPTPPRGSKQAKELWDVKALDEE